MLNSTKRPENYWTQVHWTQNWKSPIWWAFFFVRFYGLFWVIWGGFSCLRFIQLRSFFGA